MRSFKQYLAESVRSYKYKIKIASDQSDNWLQLFTMNLQKFDPIRISEPKRTPVQKSLAEFPGLKDQSVIIIDCEFRYPATPPMVQQIARLLGCDENCVRMVQTNYDDANEAEAEMYANQASHSPLLDHSELEDNGKEASREYGDSYLGRTKDEQKGKELKNKFAAKETKNAFDPFNQKAIQKSMGNKSPMSTIKRPPLPKTGAQPK